jgi:hypothetical protein
MKLYPRSALGVAFDAYRTIPALARIAIATPLLWWAERHDPADVDFGGDE